LRGDPLQGHGVKAEKPTPICVNKMLVVLNVSNPGSTLNKKAIALSCHCTREHIANNAIETQKIESEQNCSDPMMKALNSTHPHGFFYEIQSNQSLDHSLTATRQQHSRDVVLRNTSSGEIAHRIQHAFWGDRTPSPAWLPGVIMESDRITADGVHLLRVPLPTCTTISTRSWLHTPSTGHS